MGQMLDLTWFYDDTYAQRLTSGFVAEKIKKNRGSA